MGEDRASAAREREALRAGIDAGLSLIDTAEMYGNGSTESFLGSALAGRRDEIFLVSKALPQHGSAQGLAAACEASLRRLKTDHLDLYLLHWPGRIPLNETVEGMSALRAAGKITSWGVSNFDVSEMEALVRAGGDACVTNQVLYNVTRRGPEFDLIPWLGRHDVALMAYSPVEQGRLPPARQLGQIAETHGATPYQIALAWTLRSGAIAIPKAADVRHVRENARAAEIALSPAEIALIDEAFTPPKRKINLEML